MAVPNEKLQISLHYRLCRAEVAWQEPCEQRNPGWLDSNCWGPVNFNAIWLEILTTHYRCNVCVRSRRVMSPGELFSKPVALEISNCCYAIIFRVESFLKCLLQVSMDLGAGKAITFWWNSMKCFSDGFLISKDSLLAKICFKPSHKLRCMNMNRNKQTRLQPCGFPYLK